MRFEQFHGIHIQVEDLEPKQVLFLDTQQKQAQPSEVTAKEARAIVTPIDQLRLVNSDDL